ncbi:MAG: amidohydrolase [Thermoplasmata archaeon]|nr:MAG: amidohydrolase [Thermoplasmata archaeon]
MSSLLISDVTLVDGTEPTHIFVEDGVISQIGQRVDADRTIDGKGHVAMPGLVNTHTHAAMVLLRGFGDDMLLHEWLSDRIWPVEARLTPDDVYWGTRLACLEMIRTGTTAFNDMYFFGPRMADAAHDAGVRAVISEGFIDLFDDEKREANITATEATTRHIRQLKDSLVAPAVGPHAVYTVSPQGWEWVRDYAAREEILVHTHLAETAMEVEECRRDHGASPAGLLERLGVLEMPVVAAHNVHLDDEDIALMGRRGVAASHNPVSNMKLAVGGIMPWADLASANAPTVLGTDGAASNNSLDMFETMKTAALLQKLGGDPTVLPATEVLEAATVKGARALGLPGGRIAEGEAADIVLVHMRRTGMQPVHSIVSNLVYAGAGHAVTATICDGNVLMEDGFIEGEKEVLAQATNVAKDLISRE